MSYKTKKADGAEPQSHTDVSSHKKTCRSSRNVPAAMPSLRGASLRDFGKRRKPAEAVAGNSDYKKRAETDNTIMEAAQVMPAAESRGVRRKPLHHVKKAPSETVKVIPLGGLEEIGMNMTAFEYGGTIIAVDCGISFPGAEEPGVDFIIPDITYLKENAERVRGIFITHGHEDHIGALPYILKELPVPVYGTKFTIAMIENKLEQHKMKTKVRRNVIRFGQTVMLGAFKVEYIKTSHSIPDAAAIAIKSNAGVIIHTGDFKIDHTPVSGDPINLTKFAALGQKGVLALLCDSTNAARPGSTPSERTVGYTLDSLFLKYREKRILIATFASNVDRVQQILNAAYKAGKKVAFDGRSMVQVMETAASLGYIHFPENTVIDMDEIDSYDKKDTAVVMTGSQGEEMSSLTRVSKGKHMKITADKDDVVIFSAHPIPGNEKSVNEVINSFLMNGIMVVTQDVHVSGHACADDIRLLYSLVKPQYAVPMHGDFIQRTAQIQIAESLGYDEDHTRLIRSGDVLELCDGYAEVTGTVKSGRIMVDKKTIGNVGNIVINERKRMANDGAVVIIVSLSPDGEIVSGPHILCRGFVYVRDSRPLIDRMHTCVNTALKRCMKDQSWEHLQKQDLWDLIKCSIREYLEGFLWEEVKAKPVILPVIIDAEPSSAENQ